ncbi:MAG: 50S ribosomal protein L15 [Gammaproteobacteria bacterium]|nr:50S ribosomal protein L15 [Gammaproteobacteria bacterium]
MGLRLNEIAPASGSRQKRKRVGRGASAGQGGTCGRGNKGQNSRTGGGVRPGFEGGQLPLQKRVPTYGFKSRKARKTGEVRLSELNRVDGDEVTLAKLIAAGILPRSITRARIFASGQVERAVHVKGVKTTAGAKAAIEAAGGSVES